ncbi:hypothetical protein WN944_029445 [Citrus x changshan-huyou]|uniref:protein-serine/threonine phosphatase n=1 Tax=Citrus x changshan-huyou TaxID=2935761 RepID=A0AAP0QB36_9ROSI
MQKVSEFSSMVDELPEEQMAAELRWNIRIKIQRTRSFKSDEKKHKGFVEERKLQLVLNLDHTLLHCRNIKSLSSGEKYLKKQIHSFIGSLFQMANDKLVKLRPFVRTFLEQASSLVDIYLCTMSTRCYAKAAVKLLDLDSKYFSSRIIAREDFNGKDRNLTPQLRIWSLRNLRIVYGQSKRRSSWYKRRSSWYIQGG